MKNPVEQVSKSLKQLRGRLKWSLDRAARETGVSKAMLGQIERGESSPTIATLWKIATGLSVSLSSLLEPSPDGVEPPVTLFRDAASIRQPIAEDGMLVAPLYPFDPRVAFEYFELTFPASYERLSEAHKAGVIEYVTVTEGKMEILSEGEWHALEKGQSLRFNADRPHGYRNLTGEQSVIMSVIYYPSRADI